MSGGLFTSPERWTAGLLLLAALVTPFVTSCASRGGVVEQARNGVFSAEGLYEPRVVEYDNGLTLVAKQRPGIRTVSVRVNVGVGSAHYECGQTHVPHFLEHMLFGSVPGLTEAELEREFFELGAYSNAYTATLQTVYELDVFSGTAMEGLDLMAKMLNRAELQPDSFEATQQIIWREMGGEPGPVQIQTLPGGKLASGLTEAVAELSPRHFGTCEEWDAGQDVEFESVRRAYEDYYVPQNMTWIVVGDFDEDRLLGWAERRLKPVARGDAEPPTAPDVSEFQQQEYSGLAEEPGVSLLVKTNGHTGDGYYARAFISHLLDEQLYKRLRLDNALTYTPYSTSWNLSDWGMFGIMVESEEDDHDEALRIIDEIVDVLVSAPLDADEFRIVQRSLLRQWAQGVEMNADYAQHYVNSLFELRRHGKFTNDEVKVAELTPERVHEVARRLFAPGRTVIVRDGDRQQRIDAKAGGSS